MKNNDQQSNKKSKTSSNLKDGLKDELENATKTSSPLKGRTEVGLERNKAFLYKNRNKLFKKWSEKKEYIHKNRNPVYARRKEKWWCAVGCNIGFEQDGKNDYFERPVLIFKKI
jgi:hypothetical protein